MDVSVHHTAHAKKIVQGFRQGLYADNISFNVANISDWLDQQIKDRRLEERENKAFLDHILLDMPDSYKHLEKAASTLRASGSVLLFNPSITQIITAAELVRTQKLPLFLEQVSELGPSVTGGKEWDVRAVKPRARLHPKNADGTVRRQDSDPEDLSSPNDQSSSAEDLSITARDTEQSEAAMHGAQAFSMICR